MADQVQRKAVGGLEQHTARRLSYSAGSATVQAQESVLSHIVGVGA
ncbi:MAG: hypothetical protein R3C16_09420 [Hyphomonadaceae bacterium]